MSDYWHVRECYERRQNGVACNPDRCDCACHDPEDDSE